MSRYREALKFLDEMIDSRIRLSKEVYSSAICTYIKHGQLPKAESSFRMMREAGYSPDNIAFTTMMHAYSASDGDKAFALFQEMEMDNVQLVTIACSALMRAFNQGNQSARFLSVAEFIKKRKIPFSDVVFSEMTSACSIILGDWRTTTLLISMMEPLLHGLSIGLLNQVLYSIEKSGKIEIMMKGGKRLGRKQMCSTREGSVSALQTRIGLINQRVSAHLSATDDTKAPC